MSAPLRLLAGEATDFERRLLGAWSARRPSEAARDRLLALAGAGAGAAALAGAASAATKAASTSLAPKALGGFTVLVKWIAVGLLGAAATGGAVALVRRAEQPSSSLVAPLPPTTVAQAQAAPAQGAAPVPVPAAAEIAFELAPSDAPPPIKTKTTTASPARATLDDEVAMMDQARRALSRGDGAGAIASLDAYDTRFPSGALSQESTEIRIESLLLEGNRAAARRLAARYMAAHPSSPYIRRLKGLLGP